MMHLWFEVKEGKAFLFGQYCLPWAPPHPKHGEVQLQAVFPDINTARLILPNVTERK